VEKEDDEFRKAIVILDEEVGCEAVGFASIRGYITDSSVDRVAMT
jgi:hypothetical protein